MKSTQQTAIDLKKQISARSAALNQYNAEIEAQLVTLNSNKIAIKSSEKAKDEAEDAELKAQASMTKAQKKLQNVFNDTMKAEEVKDAKLEEIKMIARETKEAKFALVGVQEAADVKYEALNNRYGIIKRAIRKEMDKVRDILK